MNLIYEYIVKHAINLRHLGGFETNPEPIWNPNQDLNPNPNPNANRNPQHQILIKTLILILILTSETNLNLSKACPSDLCNSSCL